MSVDSKTSKSPPRSKMDNTKIYLEALIDKMPPKVQGYATKVLPVVLFLENMVHILGPYLVKAHALAVEGLAFIAPYYPQLIWNMVWGMVMMTFGGCFTLTIASYEAFRLAGFENFKIAIFDLKDAYHAFELGNAKDDLLDEDNDGIADVLEVDAAHLVTRKIKVFLLNCNPNEISEAFGCIYTGLLGVIAALKIQFARTIALGATIGETLETPAKKYLQPILFKMVPREYHNWVQVGITYITRTIGCSIAWFLQRIISSVHAAIKGATQFTAAFADFTGKLGYPFLSDGYFDEILAVVMSVFGLYFQLTSLFILPWYLNILLFPLVTLEMSLNVLVSISA